MATTSTSTNNVLQVPMPSSRSTGAPRFDGKEVTSFLTSIVQHGANTGITDADDLVPYIVQYSTDDVRTLIRYMPEFDPEVVGKTWNAAKSQLMLLYGHSERVPDYTESMLKDYCEKQSAKPSYSNMSDIEAYYRGFSKIAVPLIKKARITGKERDFYFISGVPKILKDWFLTQVPEAKRKRSNPPTVADSIGYLQKRFDDDSLSYEPWAEDLKAIPHEATSTLSMFNTDSPKPLPSQVPLAPNAIDELSRQIQSLNLSLSRAAGGASQAPQSGTPGGFDTQTTEQRRCFMCWKAGAHQLGLRNCPDTHTLLAANIIRFDTNTSRYVMTDGGVDLPRIPQGFVGGVADYIRAVVRDRAAAAEAPTARSNPMGLSYGGTRILDCHNFAVTSLDYASREADPVTRGGKDTSSRFDPARRPEDKGKGREVPPHMDRLSRVPRRIRLTGRTVGKIRGLRILRRAGNEDIVMRDAKKPVHGDKYHITSTIQERTDAGTVFEALLKTPITLPFLDIIGLSPQLQKLFTEATRSKREYATKPAEYSVHFADADTEIPLSTNLMETGPRHAYANASFDDIKQFLVNYGSAIARVPEGRYFAMSTGSLSIHIGDTVLTAMIDTGSELNLASASVPQRCNLAVDFEGMKWALKGIHGGPEQLRGCATDEIGHHDMILGQPFLQWFAARIEYERNGGVSLFLWKHGDRKSNPTIVVTITDPQDPRNATSITRNHRATIEEVPDEDDQDFSEDF
ncbi:hypothetical protein B0H15DRAFT_953616 [Mycena belliarum]|uniref:DUF4100 domain-containing protein n=1 Tax=Mycena belliarum TaxID=1033014 RepID=A0AAD6XI29_9AGAR|nr:hypothetical protein B0H15DRAFT_953616 [Mycena belliae]